METTTQLRSVGRVVQFYLGKFLEDFFLFLLAFRAMFPYTLRTTEASFRAAPKAKCIQCSQLRLEGRPAVTKADIILPLIL